MSRHLKIVLPDPAAARLADVAAVTGEPPATLAARFLKERLEHPDPTVRRSRPARTVEPSARRPTWLEPNDDQHTWRSDTWAAILALQTRYPEQLAGIQDGWWEHPAQLETLAALAAWRDELDQHGEDPREELLFHAQLVDYAQALCNQARGVAKAWQPGAPPDRWCT